MSATVLAPQFDSQLLLAPMFFAMAGQIDHHLLRIMRLIEVACIGNAKSMKVAVSIPDDVFAEAEALAKRLKSSRSEIYSRALGEFIGTHAPDRVTERMNDVVREVGIEPDAFSVAAARKVLKQTEW